MEGVTRADQGFPVDRAMTVRLSINAARFCSFSPGGLARLGQPSTYGAQRWQSAIIMLAANPLMGRANT